MLFRLFRLPILLSVAFVSGVLYERDRQRQECMDEIPPAQWAACED